MDAKDLSLFIYLVKIKEGIQQIAEELNGFH
jgi:hypothetical protein